MVRLAGAAVSSGSYRIEFVFSPGNFSSECGDGVCDKFFETCDSCSQDCCPNDLCTNATRVNITSSSGSEFIFFGNIQNATEDLVVLENSSFCNPPSPDAWFLFEPSSSGEVTVSTCSNETTFDTSVAIFQQNSTTSNSSISSETNASAILQSPCGPLTLISCNDDSNCSTNSLLSELTANVSAGSRYLIRVGGFSNTSFGWYRLAVSFNSTNTTGGTPTTAEVRGTPDNKWIPASVSIKVGDSVHWSWIGTHNVAQVASESDLEGMAGGFRSGPCCTSNSEFTHTFDSPGEFLYVCESHAALGMRGTVTVE